MTEDNVSLGPYQKCSTCGEYGFANRHRCPPVWYVNFARDDERYEDEEDVVRIHAHDAEEAAVKFVEKWDQDGYVIVDGCETVKVHVVAIGDLNDHEGRNFEVAGELVPHYYVQAEI